MQANAAFDGETAWMTRVEEREERVEEQSKDSRTGWFQVVERFPGADLRCPAKSSGAEGG